MKQQQKLNRTDIKNNALYFLVWNTKKKISRKIFTKMSAFLQQNQVHNLTVIMRRIENAKISCTLNLRWRKKSISRFISHSHFPFCLVVHQLFSRFFFESEMSIFWLSANFCNATKTMKITTKLCWHIDTFDIMSLSVNEC